MKKGIRLVQLAYLYFGFFLFGMAMMLVFPIIGLAHLLLPRTLAEKIKLYAMKVWASSFYLFGVWFYSRGARSAQQNWPQGPVIILANHNSLLDTPAIYLILKRFALPLAKIELTKAPVFGHLCKWITLPVDRKSAISRKKSVEDMNQYLMQGGSLLIFPEGKTNKSDRPFQSFESGAFRLSMELGVPIIPILVRNSRYCLSSESPMTLRPGVVTTECGPLFNPSDFSNLEDYKSQVWAWYAQKHDENPLWMPVAN